jgi:UDP:flavonoid glycosyltransferase YjiC (YdhE family)
MGTVLLTWELGGGIGHLMNLRPLGQELVKRGHRVVAAVKELSNVREVFAGTGIAAVAAPLVFNTRKYFDPMRGLAHILGNCAFANERILATLFEAWNTLFDLVQPDLVVADHSPNALLALHGREMTGPRRIPRVNVGLGFFCPPDVFPLPFWLKSGERHYQEQIINDERSITANVNRMLHAHGRSPLARLGEFYTEVDETILATYREFDHFGPRVETHGAVRYWGHWPYAPGISPRWPAGNGPRIYAYLKPFPTLEHVLGHLRQLGHPTLVLAGGIGRAIQERYAGPTLRFENQPLDLRLVAEQCDLAVLNAGHGTAVSLLLAGKPGVQIPLFTEQVLFAQLVEQHKLGRNADVRDPGKISAALMDVLNNPVYRTSAREFAARYAHFKPGEQIPEIVDRLERLVRSN